MPDPHEPPNTSEDDPMEEWLMISQAAREFRINRKSLNVWVWSGKIPARKDFTVFGEVFYWVKRGEVAKYLANRTKRGRPLKRS